LGGLLLFRKEHELLNQILYYTNSQPPHYVLIPGSLAEIIPLYMNLLSFSPDSMYKYEQKYPFFGLQAGVRNNSIINGWIQKYCLYLRENHRTNIKQIYHLAAIVSVQESIENPLLSNEVNVKGTLNILEASRKNDVKRVVFHKLSWKLLYPNWLKIILSLM
jgi:hypothetical protein